MWLGWAHMDNPGELSISRFLTLIPCVEYLLPCVVTQVPGTGLWTSWWGGGIVLPTTAGLYVLDIVAPSRSPAEMRHSFPQF